jgi:flagellin-like hook-associated protein FlgL
MANFNLSKLMEGKNPQAVMLAETRQLKSKWEATGLLEGLKEREQSQIAVLLENQAKQLLDEATATGTSAGSEEWSGVALPLVRRIFGEIAAKEFVSVQPMNLPSGLIFYLDFKYGTAVAGATKFNGQSLFGGSGTSAFDGDFGRTKSAVNGLYGEGRYSYTINDQSITVAAGNAVTSSATWADVNYDSSLSASVEAGTLKKITIAKSNISTAADFDAVRSYHISASSFSAADAFYPAHTEVVGSNVVFYANLMPNGGTNAAVVLGIPEVDLELRSEAIVAKTRKLKAVWTPELAQDLNAYHSIDAEAELTSMLSEYISLEIDLEILDMLKSNALTTEYWSATVGEELINGVWTGGNQSLAYQKNTWFQTLGVKLNKVSNKIHQLTLRGGANFIVASPDVCTILESIPGFSVNADKDATSFAAGVSQVGSLASRYTVYKNPYMTSNEILLGFKGSNFLETGAVYAPYVPLIMTPLVYDPSNFTPRRGVMTRYAKKMVRPEFYGKIYVKDLASI